MIAKNQQNHPNKVHLGVNIDHVATLRQARLTYEPNPLWAAVEAQIAGADGITMHLREDRRHINDNDVFAIKQACQIKLNLEMAPTLEMVKIAQKLQPQMAMLVPEGRQELTTEGGLNILADETFLKNLVGNLNDAGIHTSVFIEAEREQIQAAARIGAKTCEIHTGLYAKLFYENGRDVFHPLVQSEIKKISEAGKLINNLGMFFNAGHALNYHNVAPIANLPNINELHIGHSIFARSVFVGLRQAVSEMIALINNK